MSSIAVRQTKKVVADNRAWIYGDISGQAGRASVTLDMSKFVKADHFPDGFIRSGTPLARITDSGLYGPYSAAASDGRSTLAGHLYAYVDIEAGVDEIPTEVAALWVGPGIIQEDKLPVAVDDAGKTDVAGWFKYSSQL